ncbi:MAG: DMT family transporter [Promethearchaeota archaeon]|nr:MAG: DMT family transporter [Candidatus Lokiarchaeota archaeon]
MNNENYVKGIIFALIALFLVSLQPIVAIARPMVIDFYIFAAMTCLIQAIIFLPLMLIERKKIKSSIQIEPLNSQDFELILNGWKKNKKFLIYLGINFAIAQALFFIAYQLAGAINGSLAQQTTIIFGLFFGYIINHDKISKIQIFFVFVLFFGLFLAITQGSFNLLEFNIGVIIMIAIAALWMLAHTLTKPILDRNEMTPTQIVFARNILSGLILISTYFIFFPVGNIKMLFDPINLFFFISMGVLYGFDVLFWYKCLNNIEVSKATILVSPMPILVAFFAFIFLGEIFTIFHLIGTFIIIFSIAIIVREKKED